MCSSDLWMVLSKKNYSVISIVFLILSANTKKNPLTNGFYIN